MAVPQSLQPQSATPEADNSEGWRASRVSPDGTFHVLDGRPLYEARFDDVLPYHPPGLAPVRLGREAWHVDNAGVPAYVRRFSHTFGFYGGRAAVVSEEGWHHVLPDGTDLYEERYAWCGNYQGGFVSVRTHEGRYRHLDARGRAAYPSSWRYAGDFREGAAVVQADDGRSTHIDVSGRVLHGRWFFDLDVFHKGYARAKDGGGWMHVSHSGRPAYERRFAMVEPFYNGQARVETPDGALEVIAEDGRAMVVLRSAIAPADTTRST